MKILGIIPARYDSARFPGKPLAVIAGKTMVQRVYEQCLKSESLAEVIVATDDERIYREVETFGGKVLMTAKNHVNGTSRCNEVLQEVKKHNNIDFEFIINIQGDEPFIHPEQINELAGLFTDKNAEIVTQVKKETDLTLLGNKNVVKAILDEDGYARDFTRTIQHATFNAQNFYKHIGMYGFKSSILAKIVQLEPTANELERHLEQMRWLDNNFKIKTGITDYESISIDTKEDLEKALPLST